MPAVADICYGDVNGDRVVDLSDLATLLANFGLNGTALLSTGDLDCDGDVDLSDVAKLLSLYGSVCP